VKKTPGTGTDVWPPSATAYPYTTACTNTDLLLQWYTSNLNAFAHISHTFTHEDENNATSSDVTHEITWNQKWLSQTGIANANKFSPNGIVPPAITGLFNGDALRVWKENGITNVVGDNTRNLLLNTVSDEYMGVYAQLTKYL